MRMLSTAPVLLLSLAVPVAAQDAATYVFYHGMSKQSGVVVDDAGRSWPDAKRTFAKVLAPGTNVCVKVRNAHPVNYKYSLDVVVDTTHPELPDLGKFKDFFTSIADLLTTSDNQRTAIRSVMTQPGPGTPRDRAATGLPGALLDLINALKTLKLDLDKADTAAANSDFPGPPSVPVGGEQGFVQAQTTIAKLDSSNYHFNDPKVKERLAELHKKAKGEVTLVEHKLVVEALGAFGDLLVARRDKLRAAYAADVNASPEFCKAVVSGKNTMWLSIAKVADGKRVRDVTGADGKGDQYFRVEVQSRFERKIVSVDPLTLGVLTWNVPQFKIDGDTLAAPLENPTTAQAGIMLSLNPMSWGVADDWGLGLGLGLGLGSSDVVTDVLMGVTMSFRNTIRVGVGYGRSRQPARVRNLEVGQTLPADFGKLEDAVETGSLGKDAVYFIVALPGLSLKSK